MADVAANLNRLGITLPEPPAAVAAYRPVRLLGRHLFVSGQLPVQGGELSHAGVVEVDLALEDAQAAARIATINVLAQLRAGLGGDWSRLEGCAMVTGFVAAGPRFTAHPKVIDAASGLLVEVLGPAGEHARAAAGVASLPLGAPVEIAAQFILNG